MTGGAPAAPRLVANTGELEGIMGSEIPALPALELPHALEEGEVDVVDEE